VYIIKRRAVSSRLSYISIMEGKPASSAGIMFVPSTPASALQGLVPVWALFLLGVIIGQVRERFRGLGVGL
jgi:hypothetical protein